MKNDKKRKNRCGVVVDWDSVLKAMVQTGQTNDQIAKAMGKNTKTVYNLVHRIKHGRPVLITSASNLARALGIEDQNIIIER